MKILQPNEIELVGSWIFEGKKVKNDDTAIRIEWLIKNILNEVGYHKKYGAWETLYFDKTDGRYWVKTYPMSEMHGGGPPTLKNIPKEIAMQSFIFH